MIGKGNLIHGHLIFVNDSWNYPDVTNLKVIKQPGCFKAWRYIYVYILIPYWVRLPHHVLLIYIYIYISSSYHDHQRCQKYYIDNLHKTVWMLMWKLKYVLPCDFDELPFNTCTRLWPKYLKVHQHREGLHRHIVLHIIIDSFGISFCFGYDTKSKKTKGYSCSIEFHSETWQEDMRLKQSTSTRIHVLSPIYVRTRTLDETSIQTKSKSSG
jgi:hypothetical protein